MVSTAEIIALSNQRKQGLTSGISQLGNTVVNIMNQKNKQAEQAKSIANQRQAMDLLEVAALGGEGSEQAFNDAFRLAPKVVTSYLNAQKLQAETRTAQDKTKVDRMAIDIKEDDSKFDKGQKILKGYNDASKDFVKVRDANNRIKASIESPDAAGDIALIFNYMKMLDPGSTVREGEFATASNAGGVNTSIRNMFNKVQDGQRLQPEQREMFAGRADKLFSKAVAQNEIDKTQALNIGRRFGLDAKDIFGLEEDVIDIPDVDSAVPPTNKQGWALMEDANGNKAYVSPNGEIEEVQ